jgi:mannose-1-phosphate guanylyltransferase
MKKAFLLGAGLGTRLKPLTDRVPKPLTPFFHQPLISHTWQACKLVGISEFAINTHHLPNVWFDKIFGLGDLGEKNITLFHEDILLETGGGLRNIRQWMGDENVLVHNGDIFSSIDLTKLIQAHKLSGLPVTLALRSTGEAKHIAINEPRDRVIDIRNRLGQSDGTHLFTGIYCVNQEIFSYLPDEKITSIIPAFLALAIEGKLGAIVLDDGVWFDLGDRNSYLKAQLELYVAPLIHPKSLIANGVLVENSAIGFGAVIESGAIIKNSIVWANSRVASNARLDRCIVYSGNQIEGDHFDQDL